MTLAGHRFGPAGLPRRLLLAAPFVLRTAGARAASDDPIAAIERASGGRLGVFALDTGTGRVLAHRADERFLLASMFKGPLAAMALQRVDAGRDRLDASVAFGPGDLLPHSPFCLARLAAGRIDVGTLCEAVLEQSDNAAANLLLRRLGGPPALTAWLRGIGDPTSRVDRFELVGGWSGERDTTTPRAIAATARRLVLGDVLTPGSRARMIGWMERNDAGRTRLRAAFPAGWRAADRTGTADGTCDDYAVAWPAGGAPLVVACTLDRPDGDMPAMEAVVRAVGAAVVAWRDPR